MYKIEQGWLDSVSRVVSPNYNQRPKDTNVNTIIIHSISLPPGQYGGQEVSDFFVNQLESDKHPYFQQIAHLQVSAHVLIKRTGELIQYVNFNERAWHAGQSSFMGEENCNDFSIGIELEGTDSSSFTVAQYEQLTLLVMALMKQYRQISLDRIIGHSDIAPGRKTDPGTGFDWHEWKQKLMNMKLKNEAI